MDKRRVLDELRQRIGAVQVRCTALPACALPQEIMREGLHEFISASADHAAAFGAAFTAAGEAARRSGGPLFLILAASEARERGLPYGLGFAPFGINPDDVVTVIAATEKALLWAVEEAAACAGMGAVILALGARSKLYGFAASRRLKLRHEATGTPIYVLGSAGQQREATAVTGRWRVTGLPSIAPAGGLIGPPRIRLGLEHHASLPPQHWEMEFDAPHGLRLAAALSDRSHHEDRKRGRIAA
jgi:protein ImuA